MIVRLFHDVLLILSHLCFWNTVAMAAMSAPVGNDCFGSSPTSLFVGECLIRFDLIRKSFEPHSEKIITIKGCIHQ